MSADYLPLPPELAAPTPDADQWLEALTTEAVELADEVGLEPAEAVGHLMDLDADYLAGPEVNQARRWAVTDDGAAEWAMRHVAAATAAMEQLQAQADEWEARIHQWFTQRAKPLQAKVAFMTAHLERYALRLRAADPKAKTLTLPSGLVKTTAISPKVVLDETTPDAMAWAAEHAADAIEHPPAKLLVSRLRQHVYPKRLTTRATVTHSCGCRVLVADEEGLDIPPVGTETLCTECGVGALIGQVDEMAHRWVAVDRAGAFVPGVTVDPGGVTSKVLPA